MSAEAVMRRLGWRNAPLVLVIVACEGAVTGPVPASEWGGDHIGMVISADGAQVEYDCAAGEIDQPLVLDRGRFDVTGVHFPGVGGPVGVDRTHPRPARYQGEVSGRIMTLKVTLTDTNEDLGTFKLERGRSPFVLKCL